MLLSNAVACLILGALRVSGITSVVFQAVAHVYVGGLFAYGWRRRNSVDLLIEPHPKYETKDLSFLWLAIALTCVEVFAAVAFKRGLLTK